MKLGRDLAFHKVGRRVGRLPFAGPNFFWNQFVLANKVDLRGCCPNHDGLNPLFLGFLAPDFLPNFETKRPATVRTITISGCLGIILMYICRVCFPQDGLTNLEPVDAAGDKKSTLSECDDDAATGKPGDEQVAEGLSGETDKANDRLKALETLIIKRLASNKDDRLAGG
jgi:hypothetical protein